MTVKDDFPESLATRSIVEVAVLSEYQNMGIGQKLVEQAEKAFVEAGATISLLYVDSRSPESTHRFWKKMGYTPGDPNKKGSIVLACRQKHPPWRNCVVTGRAQLIIAT